MRRRRDVSLRVAVAFAFFVAASTAASADCRGDVEAAFQKLEKPDRPYRSELAVEGYRATIEFIPPDRARQIVDPANWTQEIPGLANWLRRILAYFAGPDRIETIQIGNRTWMRVNNKKWVEDGAAPKISPSVFPPLEMTSETAFACLGDIAFEGKTYAGYRISSPPTGGTVVVQFGADTSKTREEVSRAFKNAPPIWRTILSDHERGLPENQILSDKDQLDSPLLKIHYTYPSDLAIEPPVR